VNEPDGLAKLEARLDPADALEAVFRDTAHLIAADRVGIAVAVSEEEFEVVAEVAAGGRIDQPRHRFTAPQTAGAWVAAYGVPFVSNDPGDVTSHPRTLDFMLREQYASNCIVPIDLGRFGVHRSGVLFFFSRKREVFNGSAMSIVLRIREIVEPVVRAHLAVNDFRHGSPLPDTPAPAATRRPATLEAVERAHIVRTLQEANGVIEGHRGAAAALGINPSTLRNRMRKLNIQRTEVAAG